MTTPREKLAEGSVVDGFTLTERIYKGNMSSLWRVTRPDIDFPMVMKLPALGYGSDPTAIVGFEVEQMILPTLSGPHVPRFVATADFEERAYVVTEFIPGGCLEDRLDDKPMPAEDVTEIGSKVADALHSLHAQHVLHLDVKPRNILFRDNGDVVLIDYGLAHHTELPDLLAEEFRLPLGTAAYISPEQVLGTRTDPRSDVFALGVLLYRLATGRDPFGNPASLGGLRRRIYRDPMPPRSVNNACPRWLQEVILGCLEIDPDKRFQTPSQVAFLLWHPEQVDLTERAQRKQRDGLLTAIGRWLRFQGAEPQAAARPVSEHLADCPLIVAAIETRADGSMLNALRNAAARLMQASPEARLACVAVMKTSRIAMDINVDEQGRNIHVKILVDLKHWAHPLGLDAQRVTFHVLEHPDPASALVEYAAKNRADHLLIGARANLGMQMFLGGHAASAGPTSAMVSSLGPVAASVIADAPCTVTVVKLPAKEGER